MLRLVCKIPARRTPLPLQMTSKHPVRGRETKLRTLRSQPSREKMNQHAIVHIPHFEPKIGVYNTWRLWADVAISRWDCANPLTFIYDIVLKLNSYSEKPASRAQYQEGSFLRGKIVDLKKNTPHLLRKHLPRSCIDEVYMRLCNTVV